MSVGWPCLLYPLVAVESTLGSASGPSPSPPAVASAVRVLGSIYREAPWARKLVARLKDTVSEWHRADRPAAASLAVCPHSQDMGKELLLYTRASLDQAGEAWLPVKDAGGPGCRTKHPGKGGVQYNVSAEGLGREEGSWPRREAATLAFRFRKEAGCWCGISSDSMTPKSAF